MAKQPKIPDKIDSPVETNLWYHIQTLFPWKRQNNVETMWKQCDAGRGCTRNSSSMVCQSHALKGWVSVEPVLHVLQTGWGHIVLSLLRERALISSGAVTSAHASPARSLALLGRVRRAPEHFGLFRVTWPCSVSVAYFSFCCSRKSGTFLT